MTERRAPAPWTRRRFLGGLCAGAASPALAAVNGEPREPSLAARARRKGLLYGAAVQRKQLEDDAAFCNAVLEECGVIVPEWEMKWGAIERVRGERDYSASDWLADFARGHALKFREHTVVWANNMPNWTKTALSGEGGRDVLFAHIDDVVGRYAGRVDSIDVVNEAIEPKSGKPGYLRDSVLYRSFGPSFISESFIRARELDPNARLYYNDYGFDYDDPDSEQRRRGVLELLARLKADGVPIDGLGMQGHLRVGRRYNAEVHRRFLADVAALGLEVMVTEFDVNDRELPADLSSRGANVAGHAKAYLDTLFDERAVKGLITWGLSTKYSWLNDFAGYRRADGQNTRGLPLDENMTRTPLWRAIARAFDGAPARGRSSK